MSEHICPHCGKPTYDDDALMCIYCGENLERGVGTLGKMKYSTHWAVVTAVLVAVIAAMIVIVFW